MKEFDIPIELKNAICDNQLVVFVGAGLSFDFINIKGQKVKGWGNLVRQLLLHLKDVGHDVDVLPPLLKKYEPIKILDLLESDKSIPKSTIYDFTKDFLDLNATANDFDLHKKLFALSNKIITTNYDTAFEKAVPELRKNRAYKGKNYELTTHKDENASLLFKLHGCFEDSDSMVLFPSNYEALYQTETRDAQHSLAVLKNIVVNKSILFIGAGMGDFQINNIFKEIERLQGDYNQAHFIVTNKVLDSSLSFLTPIFIKKHSDITSVIEELVAIKESHEPEDVKLLKEQLQEVTEELESFKAMDISNKDRLLEREALKYYKKGMRLQLFERLEDAMAEYRTALELNPNLHEALYNWGVLLGKKATLKNSNDAEYLYEAAMSKFSQVIEIKTDHQEAFNNWGICLANLAKMKKGAAAVTLYELAFEKFNEAIHIKPDKYEAIYNWGTALGHLAKTKKGKEANSLCELACEKFSDVVKIKPDHYKALYNWGSCLMNLTRAKKGKDDDLYQRIFEKYDRAIQIKPDSHEAYYNWGLSLGKLAHTKSGQEADRLYKLAFEKFNNALRIKPDKHEVLLNWGNFLGELAKTKEDADKQEFHQRAFEKYSMAIQIKPDLHSALFNWGMQLVELAESKQGVDVDNLFQAAFEKYRRAISIKPNDYEAWNIWGNHLCKIANYKRDREAENLYQMAFEKYSKAAEIKPTAHSVFNNWGTSLGILARRKKGKEADELFRLAFEKLFRAIELGAGFYNLSCTYALKMDKKNAFEFRSK